MSHVCFCLSLFALITSVCVAKFTEFCFTKKNSIGEIKYRYKGLF